MANITLPVGTKVRMPDGKVGEVKRASNTIWAFTREVWWDEPGGIIPRWCRKTFHVHQLKEVE